MIKISNTTFKDLKIINGIKFDDNRGHFREIHSEKLFKRNKLIFWCMSKSNKGVLRGIHMQTKFTQTKIISVLKGEIFDVVIDCRKKSKTFGKHYTIVLSDKNCKSLFIPSGFAHGFMALKKENIIVYGNSNYRSSNSEVSISWNDPTIKIKWPKGKKIISKKDKQGKFFVDLKKSI
jgi:dTDP-4-dehydrorhamnose 3,5-epimerase